MKENNELIAEFMGIKLHDGMAVFDPTFNEPPEELQYHTSWDWIHPVVDRIASLMPSINIPEDLEALKNGTHGSDPYIDVISMSISSPINEIYEAIVKFIKWYNTTQQ